MDIEICDGASWPPSATSDSRFLPSLTQNVTVRPSFRLQKTIVHQIKRLSKPMWIIESHLDIYYDKRPKNCRERELDGKVTPIFGTISEIDISELKQHTEDYRTSF